MSNLSERVLNGIDYPAIAAKRRANYGFLSEALGTHNHFDDVREEDSVPFCYPYLPSVALPREPFFAQQIFVPYLWRDVGRQRDPFQWETDFAERLLPLPVDHRYGERDLVRVSECVRQLARQHGAEGR